MWKRGIIFQRNFASTATTATVFEQKVSKPESGFALASLDAQNPISHLALSYRAGSRYEQPNEIGLVHRLRNSFGLDTQKYESCRLIWQVGTLGGNLSTSASKDFISLNLSLPRENAHIGMSLLAEISQPATKIWDLEDSDWTMKYDLAMAHPFDQLYDGIHRAAYRTGSLANPLLAPEFRVGKIQAKDVLRFRESRLVREEGSLFAMNVDHEKLLQFLIDDVSIPVGRGTRPPSKPSPYIGGEDRVLLDSEFAHVAIVGNGGGSLADTNSVAVQSVLAAVIGQSSNSKFSYNSGYGVVTRAVNQVANLNPVGVAGLNILHSDSGLVGVYISANGERIEPYIRAAISALRTLATNGPSSDDLKVAKKTVAANVLYRAENGAEYAHDQAIQLLVTEKPLSPAEFSKLITGVSGDDVKNAAAKLVAKLSIASIGKIDQVPIIEKL